MTKYNYYTLAKHNAKLSCKILWLNIMTKTWLNLG